MAKTPHRVVFDAETLRKRGLIWNGRHLPYNPALVDNAKKMRANRTPAEKKLWFGFLRTFPFRVLRQRPIDHFVADFYCPKLSLVIEIDGGGHLSPSSIAYDKNRSSILEVYGLRVERFTNKDIFDNFEAVCRKLSAKVSSSRGSMQS
ncbi:MAG: endonuclease domain-containing protein [Chitinispirillaceae bacterium]|jgi:very-short-patch-repair endonuclease